MTIKISAITQTKKILPTVRKVSAIKTKLPSMYIQKGSMTVMSASALAMILPASDFLNKTKDDSISYNLNNYVNRNGQWYEVHYPMDGSDYYHEIPCADPYAHNQYYPIS